jgi:hypothetical protein
MDCLQRLLSIHPISAADKQAQLQPPPRFSQVIGVDEQDGRGVDKRMRDLEPMLRAGR